ncbi:hypothetical protein G7Y89_g15724 [Cudoniella acicularis]|uniref:Uncharacterized protein n=1 Tax=Cudoniella acicularis TaxID=354080 RepID=A0A8H4VJP8_9HELO|nr:hypothetical protein G7Y89_g15724 [Cudoniella acicularis]
MNDASSQHPFTFAAGGLNITVIHRSRRIIGTASAEALALASPVWKRLVEFPELSTGENSDCGTPMPTDAPDALATEETLISINAALDEVKLNSRVSWNEALGHERVESGQAAAEFDDSETTSTDAEYMNTPDATEANETLSEGHSAAFVMGLDFTEDNSDALLILLRIAHLDFKRIPFKVPFLTFLNIAILCDKYDCVELVQPWLEKWLADEKYASRIKGQEEWLYIAWVFGRQEVFQSLAVHLVRNIRVVSKGEGMRGDFCFVEGNQVFGTHQIYPPYICERIKECRRLELKALLDIPYRQARDLCSSKSLSGPKCVHKLAECDAMVYGSLVMALTKEDLWPERDYQKLSQSVSQLAGALQGIQVHRHPWTVFRNHSACNAIDIFAKVADVISQTPQPVSDDLRKHLRAQNARLSCSINTIGKFVMKKPQNGIKRMNKQELKAYETGINKYVQSEGKLRLRQNADNATLACRVIAKMFSDLAVKLGEVDSINKPAADGLFVLRFSLFEQEYRKIIHSSTSQAVLIAVYCRRFESSILPIALN